MRPGEGLAIEAGSRDFDLEAAAWDDNPGRVRLAQALARSILEEVWPTPATRALEFGCGTGLVTMALARQVGSITAVDASQGMIDVLRSKVERQGLGNVQTARVSPENPSLPGGPFSLVVASMALHHVREVEPLLGAFRAVLQPGGSLALADLDPEEGQFHHPDRSGVFHDGFERESLRAALERAGFAEVRTRTAATVEKEVAGGGSRAFTIFLMVARNPDPALPFHPPAPASSS